MDKKPTYNDLEKRIEELIAEREEKFKQLLKNSFDMLVLLDADGIQRFVSDSCIRILGYQPEELTDILVIEKMIHPDDMHNVSEGLKGILEKNAHGGTQYRHRHKNGDWVYLEAYGNNQLHNPHIKSIVLNVRDISERKAAEDALKESENRLSHLNATKDRFFSIIAHDLKSPFSSIVGISELLLEQIQKDNYNDTENCVRLIHQSSLQTMDLLNNLLDWAQTQTGKIKFNPKEVDLKNLVEIAIELLHTLADQKSITISNGIEKGTMIYADEKMLSTILRNLISNGIKFTQPRGKLHIVSKNLNDKIQISVSDNGIGMDDESVTKLFKIDSGHSTPGTKNEKGSGLGLLLCKEFIELHNGKIWVDSAPNKGSTFNFTLPSSKSGH